MKNLLKVIEDLKAENNYLKARIVELASNKKIQYGQWLIEKDVTPIPNRAFDWVYVHEDYDGPEDNRCGRAGSIQECIEEITNQEQANG